MSMGSVHKEDLIGLCEARHATRARRAGGRMDVESTGAGEDGGQNDTARRQSKDMISDMIRSQTRVIPSPSPMSTTLGRNL